MTLRYKEYLRDLLNDLEKTASRIGYNPEVGKKVNGNFDTDLLNELMKAINKIHKEIEELESQ